MFETEFSVRSQRPPFWLTTYNFCGKIIVYKWIIVLKYKIGFITLERVVGVFMAINLYKKHIILLFKC